MLLHDFSEKSNMILAKLFIYRVLYIPEPCSGIQGLALSNSWCSFFEKLSMNVFIGMCVSGGRYLGESFRSGKGV